MDRLKAVDLVKMERGEIKNVWGVNRGVRKKYVLDWYLGKR